ncbi:MAG TPA: hypothetical protein VEG32_01095 [Clostridia bacterium]|nr:hypothetical protein [Clostridia bacterium]
MTTKHTAEIIQLQQAIEARLVELGFIERPAVANISRYLADFVVLSRAFAGDTLPLFLTIDASHRDALAQLVVSIKCDVEELRDSLTDVDADLHALMLYLNQEDASPQ